MFSRQYFKDVFLSISGIPYPSLYPIVEGIPAKSGSNFTGLNTCANAFPIPKALS